MSKRNYVIENFTPLTTLEHVCGDTAETLDDVTSFVAQYVSGQTKSNVVQVMITCEDADIRFAWGANPTQAGLGHILVAGGTLIITGHKFVTDFRFINKTNGSNATLQITPEISI